MNLDTAKPTVVHSIILGDVEDPDIYIAEPLWQWGQTPAAKWVIAHSQQTPAWRRVVDPAVWGYRYDVVAWLSDRDLTYWLLKYNKTVNNPK